MSPKKPAIETPEIDTTGLSLLASLRAEWEARGKPAPEAKEAKKMKDAYMKAAKELAEAKAVVEEKQEAVYQACLVNSFLLFLYHCLSFRKFLSRFHVGILHLLSFFGFWRRLTPGFPFSSQASQQAQAGSVNLGGLDSRLLR